jgi:hypothetical protein
LVSINLAQREAPVKCLKGTLGNSKRDSRVC